MSQQKTYTVVNLQRGEEIVRQFKVANDDAARAVMLAEKDKTEERLGMTVYDPESVRLVEIADPPRSGMDVATDVMLKHIYGGAELVLGPSNPAF
jgi:hypothetical protein